HRAAVLLIFFATVFVTVGLYTLVSKDFLPSGDIGQLIITTEGPQDASFDYMVEHQQQLVDIVSRDPNIESYNSTIGAIGFRVTQNQGSIFMKLKDRSQRELSANQIIEELRPKLQQVPGIRAIMQNPPQIRLVSLVTGGQY